MAATGRFKVYDGKDNKAEYVAATKHAVHALMLASAIGDGTTIKDGHRTVVWVQGQESDAAHDSYDVAEDLIFERIQDATPDWIKKALANNAT